MYLLLQNLTYIKFIFQQKLHTHIHTISKQHNNLLYTVAYMIFKQYLF